MFVSNQKYGSCVTSRHQFLVIQPIPKVPFQFDLTSFSVTRLRVGPFVIVCALNKCFGSSFATNAARANSPQRGGPRRFQERRETTVISSSRASSSAVTPDRSQILGNGGIGLRSKLILKATASL